MTLCSPRSSIVSADTASTLAGVWSGVNPRRLPPSSGLPSCRPVASPRVCPASRVDALSGGKVAGAASPAGPPWGAPDVTGASGTLRAADATRRGAARNAAARTGRLMAGLATDAFERGAFTCSTVMGGRTVAAPCAWTVALQGNDSRSRPQPSWRTVGGGEGDTTDLGRNAGAARHHERGLTLPAQPRRTARPIGTPRPIRSRVTAMSWQVSWLTDRRPRRLPRIAPSGTMAKAHRLQLRGQPRLCPKAHRIPFSP